MSRVAWSCIPAFALLLGFGCGGRYTTNPNDTEPSASSGSGTGGNSSMPGQAGTGMVSQAGSPAAGAAPFYECSRKNAAANGGSNNPAPPNWSGEYWLATCGEGLPCTGPSAPGMPYLTPPRMRLSVKQDTVRSGTIALFETGEPLLEGHVFAARFNGGSFDVDLSGPLSMACQQNYAVRMHYDFYGQRPGMLVMNFERTPDCAGNPGEYCQGSIVSDLGDIERIAY